MGVLLYSVYIDGILFEFFMTKSIFLEFIFIISYLLLHLMLFPKFVEKKMYTFCFQILRERSPNTHID